MAKSPGIGPEFAVSNKKIVPEVSLSNPVLVEITRGSQVESVHRGAIAIVDSRGGVRFALGDIDHAHFPRSSLKPIQALPLVESGAADAFGLGDEEIALACASHSGEPMHTSRVSAWLKRLDLGEADLACGPQASRYEPVAAEMIREGQAPTRILNNCSGKHAGFLTLARHWKIATAGYERHDHPVQMVVAQTLGELSDIHSEMPWGIDGCAAPNFAIPLKAFAHALARLAAPKDATSDRGRASIRIVQAMIAHPELVAGTARPCTILMQASEGRFAVKTGAEGVYAAIVPKLGLGIALKIDDGAGRAAETAIAAVLVQMGLVGDRAVAELLHAPVLNTRDMTVGKRRPADALTSADLRSAAR
ncbi:MAG TPA: asparaginase [Rhizomicrobium sp.]|jgi:L-asparaginase II